MNVAMVLLCIALLCVCVGWLDRASRGWGVGSVVVAMVLTLIALLMSMGVLH